MSSNPLDPVAHALRGELLERVRKELHNQDEKWNVQHWRIGADHKHYETLAHFYQDKLAAARPEADEITWHDILMEELGEAFAERDHGLLIEELIQVAAVCLAIIEDVSLRGFKDDE